jgi:hypothetical protein
MREKDTRKQTAFKQPNSNGHKAHINAGSVPGNHTRTQGHHSRLPYHTADVHAAAGQAAAAPALGWQQQLQLRVHTHVISAFEQPKNTHNMACAR